MTGLFATLLKTSAGATKSSGSSLGVAVGLPAGQNVVEGTEANLMVGAAAANSNWRKAGVAAIAALVTILPLLVGIWFFYKAGKQYADYAVGAIIVGIGVHEVMEGLKDRPKGRGQPRPHALDGPLGIDPADPGQIKAFQSAHGLEPDGVVGPRTRGAILAELRRRGDDPRPNRLGVDVTDEDSVMAFQRSTGLHPDGVVGPRTQGALAAESARVVPDATDPDSVRIFQRRNRLPETAVIDLRTQGALHAFCSRNDVEPGMSNGKTSFADHIDLTSGEEITRFQRERGLPESGVLDALTQGALRAEIEWHGRQPGFDPGDPAEVRNFQSAHGLQTTGVVDEQTQESIRAALQTREIPRGGRWAALGIDPTDPESVRAFQALHGLDPSGEVDSETREELRRAEVWMAGIDPADPVSVRRFQAGQGLETTGVVDAETQGALRLHREDLRQRYDGVQTDGMPAWCPLDPADPGSIREFQRDHGLSESGAIGSATQSTLRSVVAEQRRRALEQAEDNGEGGGLISRYKDAWPGYFGFLLEGGEAGLFTIGIAQGTHQYFAAAVAGGAAFATPWLGLIWLRDWLQSRPKWVFELTIGGVLVTAGAIFGLLRVGGVYG